jgi:hypothetical protein
MVEQETRYTSMPPKTKTAKTYGWERQDPQDVHGATSKASPQSRDHPQEAKRRRLTETTKETTKETSWEAKTAVDKKKRILNQISPRSV